MPSSKSKKPRAGRFAKILRFTLAVLGAFYLFWIGSLVLFDQGRPFDELAPKAAEYLAGKTLEIEVGLGAGGSHTATVWTCDLSKEYVTINADYRT